MKKIKVGLIGTGMIGKAAHIPGFTSVPEECELAWICDLKPKALAEGSAMVPSAKTTDDYKVLLADPEIDAIAVATPTPALARSHSDWLGRAVEKKARAPTTPVKMPNNTAKATLVWSRRPNGAVWAPT